jgi:hypothetical protein
MDEKEQAWLRLKCFEIVVANYKLGLVANEDELCKTADRLYRWATTGDAP